jgi:hypothetical protein
MTSFRTARNIPDPGAVSKVTNVAWRNVAKGILVLDIPDVMALFAACSEAKTGEPTSKRSCGSRPGRSSRTERIRER